MLQNGNFSLFYIIFRYSIFRPQRQNKFFKAQKNCKESIRGKSDLFCDFFKTEIFTKILTKIDEKQG